MAIAKEKSRYATQIRRILAPTDYSVQAGTALAWAASLAKDYDAKVVLLHVVDTQLAVMADVSTDMAATGAMGQVLESARVEAGELMKQLAERFPAAETMIEEGDPGKVIVKVAGDIGADIIVMGTHGRTGLAHVLFGSVAESVVRNSRIPVLTARQLDEP